MSTTHTFDPDATPEQKASQAGKGKDQLKSVQSQAKQNESFGEREATVDQGPSVVLPTITVEDHDEKKELKVQTNDDAVSPTTNEPPSPETPPGAMPSGAAPPIPDWYVVGWRQHAGVDKEEVNTQEEKDRAILAQFVNEQYYGEWYHNGAIIIFAVFASHFLTRFHFGLGWMLIILAVCHTYYTTSMRRHIRASRDDINRQLIKTRLTLPSEHETADWINNFLDRFWLIYEPVLSHTITASVDQVLSSNTPPFLDSLRLSEFTLGTKAPRIERVKTYPDTDEDIVMMDWALSFTPNDTMDITPRQLAKKVNPKIVLSVRVGKGLATAGLPILLEDITFSGLMRIRMKLMTNFPHIQIVDISFLEKPVIDYVLKPLGGETFGFDIANIPGLSSFIRDMTHATLAPMMYDPNVFTLNLEQMLSGEPIDSAVGVVKVTIHNARGIKGVKIGGGSPDPYVGICVEGRPEVGKTKWKHNTYNPTWDETKFILITSTNLHENLFFNVWDYNDHRKDALLGTATFELGVLAEDAVQENVARTILLDGKDRGELRFDVGYYPVLKPALGEDGQLTELPETSVGIVRLTIHQAKDLDASKSLSGDLNPLAKVYLGSQPNKAIHTTQCFKHTLSPVWESPHEFLCADRKNSIITVKVIDDRDFLKDPVVGYLSIRLDDLLEFSAPTSTEQKRDWFPLSNCKTGRLRISAEWKPVDMAGSLAGVGAYTKPIGVVRLHLDRATDVKNVEAALGGKSDPYVRVQVKNVTRGRTEVVNNNLNPVWDQIIYIPVHSLRESFLLELMDYQHLTKDRSLGSVELLVADLAEEDPEYSETNNKYKYRSTGKKNATDPIKLDKGTNAFKGTLHYVAEFVPAVDLAGVEFDMSQDDPLGMGVPRTSTINALKGLGSGSNGSGEDVTTDGEVAASDVEEPDTQGTPNEVTIKRYGHKKNAKSTDTTASRATASSKGEANGVNGEVNGENGEVAVNGDAKKEEEKKGVVISHDELLTHQSGILVVNVLSGNIAKKARLEVLLDNGYWPCFSTQRAKSRKASWAHVGEGFIKELDFSQVWLRLNEADEGEKDDIVAQWRGDAKQFLKQTMEGPQTFTLKNDEEENSSTVVVESRYVPVPVKLEPRESVNNQGMLRVWLLEGRDLMAADRSGKSDPYAVFSLNDRKVYKSETVKKTLNPDWNEEFTCSIPSRTGANFAIEVYDWDQVGRSDPLGSATIDLTDIEPFEATERTLPLTLEKHGQKGRVRIRMMFQPEIIVKSRQKTSTFSSAGRAMTQIGGLPVQAGKGVFHGVAGVFKKGDKESEMHAEMQSAVPESLPSGQHGVPELPTGVTPAFPSSNDGHERAASNGEPGTLRLTVIDAKDLSSGDYKPYAVIRVGDKENKTKHTGKTASPEWNESFTFSASNLTPKIFLWVHDHKTLGKDKLLGEGEVDIWRHVSAEHISAAEVSVELQNGSGKVRLRVEFDPSAKPQRRSSISSTSERNASRTLSMSSPSRFSLSRKRGAAISDDD